MMKGQSFASQIATGLLVGLLTHPSQATTEAERRYGVVVEEVTDDSALEKAGLEPGDLLLAWERLPSPTNPEGAAGELRSPFDWEWVKVEQAPRGTVRLSGQRRGDPSHWTVEPGLWEAKVRPTMPGSVLEEYLRGQEMVAAGELGSGAALWAQLADQEDDELLRCWFYLRAGETWHERQSWEKAHVAYRSALEAARAPASQVVIRNAIGQVYLRQYDLDQAEASYDSVLESYRRAWGEGLGFALGITKLGIVAKRRGRLAEATQNHRRALEIRQRLAPDSLAVAESLNELGVIAWKRDQLTEAEASHQQARAIRARLAPGSLLEAASVGNLGLVAQSRGQLELAAEHYEQVLSIQRELAPDSLPLALTLNNLGNVALVRGQLDVAAGHYRQALEIQQRLAPDSLHVAGCLNNLGLVYKKQRRLDRATIHYQQALKIQQKLAHETLDVAISLHNLGFTFLMQDQLAVAEEYFQNALGIQQRLAPNSLAMATTFHSLGVVAGKRGNLEVAKDHLYKALAIQQELAPDSIGVTTIYDQLASIAWKQDRMDLSAEYQMRNLKILQRLAPGTINIAVTFNRLATIAEIRDQPDLADRYFRQSLESLESQVGKVSDSQWIQSAFRARHRALYQEYMESLLKEEPEHAFAILERSRAKSFLTLLAERELAFIDIPDALDRQRRSLVARQDRKRQQLAVLSATRDREKVEKLQAELSDLYQERDDLRARIRKESPHLANLEEPRHLDFAGARKTLDPGTVMLSYSVAKNQTHLFVVAPDQRLAVHTLAIGEDDLRKEIEALRRLIEHASSESQLGPMSRKSLERPGKRLYRLLVKPATAMVTVAERVVLIPDGPLHLLPFSALIRETGGDASSDGDWQYFAQWKPLHFVLSATVYAELKKSRRTEAPTVGGGPLFVALGDPLYALNGEHGESEPITDVRVRSSRERCGFAVERLPASRREVLDIAGLYRSVRTYLGQGAREESVKSLEEDARIVHIAAHGCLDDQLPLNSGLFLTFPEGFPEDRDNGFLQAWEIFESVRFDADLVVLSACESGLSQEQGGEGLNSLTRAFQYAGARTVAASLWQVDDQVTAELMVRFYRHLRGGKTKDAALQAAQIELIRGPIEVQDEDGQVRQIDASTPYYWAAFQLYGDWR